MLAQFFYLRKRNRCRSVLIGVVTIALAMKGWHRSFTYVNGIDVGVVLLLDNDETGMSL